jgi:hypothetical protein
MPGIGVYGKRSKAPGFIGGLGARGSTLTFSRRVGLCGDVDALPVSRLGIEVCGVRSPC